MLSPTPEGSRDRLVELIGGYRPTALVHAAADLGLADRLADGPAGTAALAELLDLHEPTLGPLLRALAGLGILYQDDQGRYGLTGTGELLRRDHPHSLHSAAVYFGGMSYRAYAGLGRAARTGDVAFDSEFGTDYYDHLRRHPDLAEHYHRMIALPEGAGEVIARLYDFGGARSIVDVGGGNGSLLAQVLRLAPDAKGLVLDMALCEPMARETFSAQGLADRGRFTAGDFRTAVPAGGDVYLLSRVLANWPAPTATRVLANCRAAMDRDARLLIFEMVMPERAEEGTFAVEGDVNALAHFGGGVRTRREFEDLVGSAGMVLERVRRVDPAAHWSLLECSTGEGR